MTGDSTQLQAPVILIENYGRDPLFNIAAEEFAVRHLDDEVLMLWENDWSVVVGKHQIPYAEINPQIVFENTLPVIRRISGGGTVVHGPGNLNFTIISDNSKRANKIDFDYHTMPVIKFLKSLGLNVQRSSISNLTINNLKISGNAAHIYKNRSLHHGTLLFNTDLQRLLGYLQRQDQPYSSKAIPSNRVPVVNIVDLLKESLNFQEFKQSLFNYLWNTLSIKEIRPFSTIENQAIHKLVDEKYRQFKWNYGYSPDYIFRKQFSFDGQRVEVSFKVVKGMVVDFSIIGHKHQQLFTKIFNGCAHWPETFREKISSSALSALFSKDQINHLIHELF